MQKKIIALAVAGLASTAAFAQSNVTVYGTVDMGLAVVKSTGSAVGDRTYNNPDMATYTDTTTGNQGAVSRLDNNSSHIGFKGVEDLGNGLKALFQYEVGFNADNGSTGSGFGGARDSFIGLTSNVGTVVAGTLTAPMRTMGAKVELVPGAAGFGSMATLTGTFNTTTALVGTVKTGADERSSNAVAYVSPTFYGVSLTAAYVNGENKTKTSGYCDNGLMSCTYGDHSGAYTVVGENVNQKQYQFAAQYENGPLWAAVAYHKTKDMTLAGNAKTLWDGGNGRDYLSYTQNGQDARVWRVAATYAFPTQTKLTALYDNTKVDVGSMLAGDAALGAATGVTAKRAAWSLGVAQGFGNNTVGLEYSQAGKTKVEGNGLADTGAKMVTAVYSYALSKRTSVHARYSVLKNDNNSATGFYLNSVSGNGATGNIGVDYSGAMVGLRHSF